MSRISTGHLKHYKARKINFEKKCKILYFIFMFKETIWQTEVSSKARRDVGTKILIHQNKKL